MWARIRKASGDDDAVNVRALQIAGWKPVPGELVLGRIDGAIAPLRQRTMDGGVAVEGMQLMYRPKQATADAHKIRDRMASEPLDRVLAEYQANINKTGLMSSEMPRSTFDTKEYRGREAVAQLDGDD